jgi:hypothetical protein
MSCQRSQSDPIISKLQSHVLLQKGDMQGKTPNHFTLSLGFSLFNAVCICENDCKICNSNPLVPSIKLCTFVCIPAMKSDCETYNSNLVLDLVPSIKLCIFVYFRFRLKKNLHVLPEETKQQHNSQDAVSCATSTGRYAN